MNNQTRTRPRIYLIGSLRNPDIPHIGLELKQAGFDVFDDWWSASPDADDWWQSHETLKGSDYKAALYGPHATSVFEFDRKYLYQSDIAVLIMPAGRSGHIEYGHMTGRGKPSYVLFDKKPDRYDVMYRFGTDVCFSLDELKETLKRNHLNNG
jgi:hypothetical protein